MLRVFASTRPGRSSHGGPTTSFAQVSFKDSMWDFLAFEGAESDVKAEV